MSKNSFSESMIIKGLGRAADAISEGFSKSAFGRVMSAYDSEKNDVSRSVIVSFFGALFSRMKLKKLQIKLMHGFADSPVFAFLNSLLERVLSSRVRQLGVLLFSFGFYSSLMYALGTYSFPERYAGSFISLGIGVLAVLIALPLIISSKTVYESVFESVILYPVMTGIFGFRKREISSHENRKVRLSMPFIIGLVFGTMTFFVCSERLLFITLFFIICCLVIASPEGGLILLISFAPLCSARNLGFFSVFILFSYLFKVLRGKRSMKFEMCDVTILLYGLAVLFGGFFSIRPSISLSYSVKLTAFVLLYFVCVNIISSDKWITRFRNSFVFSCTMCVIVGALQLAAGKSTHFLLEYKGVSDSIVSLFADSNGFAQMIVLCGFFVFSTLLCTEKRIRKLFALLIIALELFCLYCTMSVWAMIAFVISFFVLLLIYSNRNIFLIIGFLILAPASQYILPENANAVISALKESGVAYIASKLPVWRSAFNMAGDNILGGIGKGAFSVMFPSYISESTVNATSAENIYLQEIIETGIFGVLLFALCMFIFFQSVLKLHRKGTKQFVCDSSAGIAGVVGILLIGFVYNVWEDERLFMMFWLVVGFTSACRRGRLMKMRSDRGGYEYD